MNATIVRTLHQAEACIGGLRGIRGHQPVVLTSGGYDPIHPGHISCMQDIKKIIPNAILVVVVNGDEFLERKKGAAFMPLDVRARIVSAINGVDIVLAFNPSYAPDLTVCEPLKAIKPDVFVKGGDRTAGNTPEQEVCEALGIRTIYGCGDKKLWSSSDYLKDWVEKFKSQ